MSRGGWVLAIIAAVIIWHNPVGAGHFVLEVWDKGAAFLASIFG